MADLSELYSKAPQPMDLGAMLGIADRALSLKSGLAMSDMLKQSVDPATGQTDPNKLGNLIRQAPANVRVSPADAQTVQGLNINQFGLQKSQQDVVLNTLGALAQKRNLSMTDIYPAITGLKGAFPNLPTQMLTGWLDGAQNKSGAALRAHLGDLQKIAIGAAGTAEPFGRVGPTGAPEAVPAGTFLEGSTNPEPPAGGPQRGPLPPAPGMRTGVAPGFTEVAGATAGAVNRMHDMADNAPIEIANYQNLGALSAEAATGPTANFEKRANELWQRLAPGSKLTLTPKALADTEEFAKIAEQLAGQQAAGAHATDSFLKNAYGSNPNLELSKLGREGIIHMLMGNTDAAVFKREKWLDYKNGMVDGQRHDENEFRDWSHRFNKQFDPRVFQFSRMNADERQHFLEIHKEKPGGKFEKTLHRAITEGWITQ